LWSFALLMNNVIAPLVSPDRILDDAWPWPGNPVALAVVIMSLLLFGYTRTSGCDCELSLDLGLYYEVALALAIGLVNQWTPNTIGLSWICVLILMHAIIVPHTPRKTLGSCLHGPDRHPGGQGARRSGPDHAPDRLDLPAQLPVCPVRGAAGEDRHPAGSAGEEGPGPGELPAG
jgi:hypothetical protein